VVYSGVAMKVAFSMTGEAYLLQQLSGGQKSIVALALIFAIQRLDPAPFYLFDEIDANLDATHRQAVANVIRKQSGDHAQFITTTFRPEFVNAGEKWFGVTHRNKVSSVQEVTLDVALTFINKDEGKQDGLQT
jgi:structural maintenance of chromosome 3 (chondroitin sulfate proteoglycan 6)